MSTALSESCDTLLAADETRLRAEIEVLEGRLKLLRLVLSMKVCPPEVEVVIPPSVVAAVAQSMEDDPPPSVQVGDPVPLDTSRVRNGVGMINPIIPSPGHPFHCDEAARLADVRRGLGVKKDEDEGPSPLPCSRGCLPKAERVTVLRHKVVLLLDKEGDSMGWYAIAKMCDIQHPSFTRIMSCDWFWYHADDHSYGLTPLGKDMATRLKAGGAS